MVKRYELSDRQWERVRTCCRVRWRSWPVGARQPAIRQRRPLGVASGAHWHDLPERYGKWKTVHTRFSRWAKAGVWERMFEALLRDRDNQYLMLDSTLVRAHQQAATGKGGPKIRRWGVPEED